MFILKFVRFVLGYVLFTATGGFPERFINLCTQHNIPLWDLKHLGDTVEGKTTVSGYKRIRPAARRSGVRVRISKKCGLPFLRERNKKRAGLLVGVALAALLLCILSTRIWTVRVEGNVQIHDEQILRAAKSLGVEMGARTSKLDAQKIAKELQNQVEGLSWAAVNIDACKAVIEVRESTPKPDILDTKTPANIVASEDGVLTRIEVYSGTAALPVGSAVLKGDLLISGVVLNKDNSESLHGAQGHVYAKVERNIDCSAENREFLKLSGENTRYVLYCVGLKLPLGRPLAGDVYTVETYLSNGETTLPVGLLREHTAAFSAPFTLPSSDSQARYAAKLFAEEYRAIWLDSVILTTDISFDFDKETPFVRGKITCEKEIGINQEIFVEKISD